jgi:hypothetical protein
MTDVVMIAPSGVRLIFKTDGTTASVADNGTVTVSGDDVPALLRQGFRFGGDTASALPASPAAGRLIYDTLRRRMLVGDGAKWDDLVGTDLVINDDFIGAVAAFPTTAESGMAWMSKIVGAAPPTVAMVADAANGVARCALTADSQKQDAALYMGDQRCIDLSKKPIVEIRAKLSTLPTSGTKVVMGLAGDWVDGPDAIAYSAWVAASGSGALLVEADDAATDSSAASGVTVTTADWFNVRIDFSDLTALKFYLDDTLIATETAIPFAATGANAILQPYVGAYKASGTSVGAVDVDYIRVWSERA